MARQYTKKTGKVIIGAIDENGTLEDLRNRLAQLEIDAKARDITDLGYSAEVDYSDCYYSGDMPSLLFEVYGTWTESDEDFEKRKPKNKTPQK